MIHPDGFVAGPGVPGRVRAIRSSTPSDVFYDGNSQGGIFGGTVMSIAQDITRGVLGVPGMNYSLLLTRSVDFDALRRRSSIRRTRTSSHAPAHPGASSRCCGIARIRTATRTT